VPIGVSLSMCDELKSIIFINLNNDVRSVLILTLFYIYKFCSEFFSLNEFLWVIGRRSDFN